MRLIPLTNRHERVTAKVLERGLGGADYQLNKKVAVKDIISAAKDEQQQWPRPRQRIWWTGHFDFVATSRPDDKPMFVVEFDGPSHDLSDAQARDRAKNTLCRDVGLPILRISGDGNMLMQYERTSVVEHMVRRFVEWDQEQPADFDAFDMQHRFLPLQNMIIRLVSKFKELKALYAFDDEVTRLEFSAHPGGLDFSSRPHRLAAHAVAYQRHRTCTRYACHGGRVSGPGMLTLLSVEKRISFSWDLPVDDEKWADIGNLRVPEHQFQFSDLPGNCLPQVLEDVAEYLALVDVEQWALAQLGGDASELLR